MTREELREHCERQVEACLVWHKMSGEPLGLMYEEHKLILDLLDQDADKEKRLEELLESLQTANATNTTLIKLLDGKQKPCEDAVSRKAVKEMLNARGQKAIMTFDHFIELLYKLPSVTPTKSKCEKLADDINPAEYMFTHYARLTPEEAEHDLFRLDKETGEYIPLTDNTNYALPETSEQFKDIKQAVIQGCANMMKAVGEKL